MKFRNESEQEIAVKLYTEVFKVSPGDLIEIPDEILYIVESRGLPLKPVLANGPDKSSEGTNSELVGLPEQLPVQEPAAGVSTPVRRKRRASNDD